MSYDDNCCLEYEPLEDFRPDRKELCLESRKVRLYIAAHPGSTSLEIKNGTGMKNEHPLFFLMHHGLIKFKRETRGDRRPNCWYVVPQ